MRMKCLARGKYVVWKNEALGKRYKIGCCSARYDEGWSGSIKGGTERLNGELKRGSDGPKDRACKVSVGEKR